MVFIKQTPTNLEGDHFLVDMDCGVLSFRDRYHRKLNRSPFSVFGYRIQRSNVREAASFSKMYDTGIIDSVAIS